MSVSMKTTTARVALGTVLMGAVPMAPLVPTAIAQAIAQVIADPNAAAANRPTMHESLNKTPVQNIVAPNASGLSHNKLQEFNVDQRNLIINNSRVNAISNLGGAVVANPNLANGEARIILNEVTGGNRSILQGNQELLGGRAAYILANPNGITCAGCGFLNFPRVTMTTGVPVINGDVLNGFRVNGGDISIGGAGLNAEGIDAFDILTRSVTFAGQVNTRALNVVAGRNDVDYDTLAATALTDAPATPAPSWAIDSSALGGMYAGRIALVSTEAGVGVRLQGGAAATVDDVTLTSAGQIQIKSDVSAERDVKLVSTQAASVAGAEVLVDGATVYAKRDATLSGGDVVLTGGRLGSGAALSLSGATLTDSGGLRDAGSTLTVAMTGAMSLTNTALRSTGNAAITAGSLSVDAASNDGGAKGLRSGGTLTVNVSGTVDNAGLIAGDDGLTLTAAQLDNASTGLIRAGDTAPADATLTVTGAITQLGTVSSTGTMTATATSLTNSGTVQAGGAMTLNVGTLSNTATALQDAYITSVGNLTIGQNNRLYNTASTAKRAIIASTAGALGINSTSGTQSTQEVRNQGGLLFGKTGMTVTVSRWLLNEVANGRRGSIYADTGTMTLGGVNQAAIDAAGSAITVKNLDSDIENRIGSINILADVFENSATAYTPDKTTTTSTRTWGTFDYDGTFDDAGDLIGVEGDCGTYGDHFDGGVVGKRCTQSVTVTKEVLTNGTSMRSKLLAGGGIDIYVGSSALNYISAISAGGNIKIHGSAGATFENRAVTLMHSEQAQVWRYDHGGQTLDPAGDCYSSGTYNKCWFESGDFVPNKRKKFTDISLASAPTRYTIGVGSTVEAGGTVTISVSELVNVNSGTKKALTPPSTSPSTQTASAPAAAPLAAIGSLAQSPFFVPSVNPNALFLFETDPKLMSLEGLYGSDLFLKSLNLDPTDYLRVGDAYYEQQLIRQQLLDQAGQRFILEGLTSENDQYKQLLQNGVAAGLELKLRVGVSLTPEQIASLDKDVVWMVETVVQGKKVLVPQLYLADTTRASLANGAKIVGANIDIQTTGDMSNSGAIVARNALNIDAGGTVTNRLGDISGGNVAITAVGDVLNQSGTIRGTDVSVTSTTGSVINETLTQDVTVYGAVGSGTNTVMGATAGISATNTLNIDAAKGIISRGAELNAGQDANLVAGGDIKLTAIEQKNYSASRTYTEANGYTTIEEHTEQTTKQVGSTLNVGGNLTAKAGNDIRLEASTANVGGNADLDAGRDIVITALAETSKTSSSVSTESWNTSSSEVTTIDQTKGKAAGLNVGGNLGLKSGGNTTIKGSDVTVGGDLDVKGIGGNLEVTTFEETTNVVTKIKQKAILGGKVKADAGDNASQSSIGGSGTLVSSRTETTKIDALTNRGSSLSVGGNLNAGPGAIKGDALIKGSDLAVGGDMNLHAGGDVKFEAAADKVHIEQTVKSNSLTLSASGSAGGAQVSLGYQRDESQSTADQSTARVSTVTVGGNANINAGKDFTDEGTIVQAGGDIAVEAEKIHVKAAQNTYSETGSTLSVSVSLGVKAETGLDGIVAAAVGADNKGKFDGAAASEALNGLSVPDAGSVKAELSVSVDKTNSNSHGNTAQASSFSSGGNTSFKARSGDATFEGTDVTAGGGISVTADKGSVKILAAESGTYSETNKTSVSVTVGVSGDGTISGEGEGSSSKEVSSTTSQKAGTFKAGTGNIDITAQNNVELVGTNFEAEQGGVGIEAKTGTIDFKAARDTTYDHSSEKSASASVSANVGGKEGSVGGGYSESSTTSETSTGTAGSIKAKNVTLKSKGNMTLEGTNIAATESASLESTDGKVDIQAVKNTDVTTTKGFSMEFGVDASATGGGVSGGGSRTDEFESNTTRTAGSVSAANLTIKAGNGISLEGTKVTATDSANIDAGAGKLELKAATKESVKKVNNTSASVGLSADKKEQSGQASVKASHEFEDTQKTTHDNVTLNLGKNATVKAAGGVSVTGTAAGVADLTNALAGAGAQDISTTTLVDVDRSEKRSGGASVGIIVPDKKVRKEVADTAKQARDSRVGTAVSNKADSATTAIANAASKAKTGVRNTLGDAGNAIRNVGKDQTTAQANNTAHEANNKQRIEATLTKTTQRDTDSANRQYDNTQALATRQQTQKVAAIDGTQARLDQNALKARDAADQKAQAVHDAALAKLGPNATQDDRDEVANQLRRDKSDNQTSYATKLQGNAAEAVAKRDALIDREGNRRVEAENKLTERLSGVVDKKATPNNQVLSITDKGALQGRAAERGSLAEANATKAKADAKALSDKQVALARADALTDPSQAAVKRQEAEDGYQSALAANRKSRDEAGIDATVARREKEIGAQTEVRQTKVAAAAERHVDAGIRAAEDAKTAAQTSKDDAETQFQQVQNDVNATDEAKRVARGKRDTEQRKLEQATQKVNDLTARREADIQAQTTALNAELNTQNQSLMSDLRTHADDEKRVAEQVRKQETTRLEAAERARDREERIRNNTNLTETQRAEELERRRLNTVDNRAQILINQAKDSNLKRAEQARDDADKAAELRAIDPTLSPADREQAETEINNRYATLANERETQRVSAAEAEKTKARDRILAERQANQTLAHAKDAAKTTQDAADQAINDQLATDLGGIDPALSQADKDARQLELTRAADLEKARHQATRDQAVADAEKVHRDTLANDAHQSTLNAVAEKKRQALDEWDAQNPGALDADRQAYEATLDTTHQATIAEANARKLAATKESQAEHKQKLANLEKAKQDAEVLGDATLKPKQREARLAKNAKDEQEALAAAKQLRAEATTDRAPWLTAEEKAALAKAKLDASAAAAKAAKQLSLAQRAKKAGVRGQRWLQALTSLGLTPNPEENDEKEEAAAPTLTSLLPLAQQFQARDQGMALQALRDPDVQQGAAAANAVKAIRAEAREALLKDITADYKDGNPLGVMTVADQAQFLKDQGLLGEGEQLPPAQVMSRFQAALDAQVAQIQPDLEQKTAILDAFGLLPTNQEERDKVNIDEDYQKMLQKAQDALKRVVVDEMKLPASRAQQLGATLMP